MTTGGFPGRRVATRIHAAAASPFGLSEPASGSEWPVVPGAGRLPARHRDDRDTAPDCAFRRPRRLQPTTLPVAAPWMAAPYHPVTRASLEIFLAISLPPLARRPHLAPVTTRFPNFAPPSASRVVTGGNRASSGREPPQLAQIPVDHATPSPLFVSGDTYTTRSLPSLSHACRTGSRVKGWLGRHPPGQSAQAPTPPLTRCARPTVRTVRRESSATHKRHGPADHRESHQTVHRHQHPPRRPRGRSTPRDRPRHRPVRGRHRRNAAMARRPRVNTPAAGSGAAPGPTAELVRMRVSRTPASDRQEPNRLHHRNDAHALNPQRPVHVRPQRRYRRIQTRTLDQVLVPSSRCGLDRLGNRFRLTALNSGPLKLAGPRACDRPGTPPSGSGRSRSR